MVAIWVASAADWETCLAACWAAAAVAAEIAVPLADCWVKFSKGCFRALEAPHKPRDDAEVGAHQPDAEAVAESKICWERFLVVAIKSADHHAPGQHRGAGKPRHPAEVWATCWEIFSAVAASQPVPKEADAPAKPQCLHGRDAAAAVHRNKTAI